MSQARIQVTLDAEVLLVFQVRQKDGQPLTEFTAHVATLPHYAAVPVRGDVIWKYKGTRQIAPDHVEVVYTMFGSPDGEVWDTKEETVLASPPSRRLINDS